MPNLYMLIINTSDLDFLLKSTSHVCLLCHSSNELCQEKLGQVGFQFQTYRYKCRNLLANILYWVDERTDRVEFSNLEGGHRQVLTTIAGEKLQNIGIHGQYLYYSALNRP